MELTIDKEFRDLCRPLTNEERSILKASIESDGCRDAIVVWANHDDTILDGHNRYEICEEIGIRFKINAISLPDRQACIEWIIANQLGKRNLTEEEKSFLRGKRYRAEKKQGERTDITSAHFEQKSTTADKLAAEYSTSPATIRRDAGFADAVDEIAANVGTEAKSEVLAGTSGLTRKQIQDVAATPPQEQAKAYEKAKAACHVSKNTGVPEWYTPDEYLDAVREVMESIDLDPASSEIAQKRVKAKRFFTMADDGLTKQWQGRIYLNPPYTAGLVDKFLAKLGVHLKAGEVSEAIVLVNNATDTAWMQDAAKAASVICFPKGRIKFLDENGKPGAPLQGQAILYFGPEGARFADTFQQFGFCAEIVAE